MAEPSETQKELIDLRNTLCGYQVAANRMKERESDRRFTILSLLLCMFLILGGMSVGIAYIVRTLQDVESKQGRVANCLLEQLTEHRVDTRYSNAEEAKAHGYAYPDPSGVVQPPPTSIDLRVCKEFAHTSGGAK